MQIVRVVSCNDLRLDLCIVVRLVRNYRSHASLLAIPNRLFYADELVAAADQAALLPPRWEHLCPAYDEPTAPNIMPAAAGLDLVTVDQTVEAQPASFEPHGKVQTGATSLVPENGKTKSSKIGALLEVNVAGEGAWLLDDYEVSTVRHGKLPSKATPWSGQLGHALIELDGSGT